MRKLRYYEEGTLNDRRELELELLEIGYKMRKMLIREGFNNLEIRVSEESIRIENDRFITDKDNPLEVYMTLTPTRAFVKLEDDDDDDDDDDIDDDDDDDDDDDEEGDED